MMKDKLQINLEKLDRLNSNIFNSDKSIDEFVSKPEEEEKVLEACAKYDFVEYPINLHKEIENNESYWVAEHPDLPGCITYGETKGEALHNLEDAKKGWIYARLCDGETVPEPKFKEDIKECSGRILLRLPKELHFKLLGKARNDSTSLNQEILYLISYALGEMSSNKKVNKA